MKRIIVNGANGYVASNFIKTLLNNNFEVVALARGTKKKSATRRLEEALTKINDGPFSNPGNLTVYNYSLTEPHFGLPDKALKQIFSKKADYFHFAASLKYDYKSKSELLTTNVEGVKNSMEVFSDYAPANSRFFFIGTAYSCGHISGIFEEKFYPDLEISAFRNYYEWSKRLAENTVKTQIYAGLNAHVIRLSQVVGNNQTGETKTDYGIFDFARRIYSLSKRYPNHSIRAGITPEGTQNLIPVNVVVNYLMQVVKTDKLPVIMNFVSRYPTKNIHIINALKKLLPLEIIPAPNLKHDEMSSLERLMAVGMSFTGNYTNIDIKFDTSACDRVLTTTHDEMNEQVVKKMLKYFINNECEKPEPVSEENILPNQN